MKKIILGLLLIIAFGGYTFMQKSQKDNAQVAKLTDNSLTVPKNETPTPTTNPAPKQAPVTAPKPTPTTIPKTPSTPVAATGKFKDGTYTGNTIDVYYGNLQVQAVIYGGKLTNVNILQSPNDRDNSIRIAQRSLPILTQEAIAAQSAQVDSVSGATMDSNGFIQSLQSALDQAATS
ncbi:MAG: FMN-binding protein [bacterium]